MLALSMPFALLAFMNVKYNEIETLPDFVEAIKIRVDAFIKRHGYFKKNLLP